MALTDHDGLFGLETARVRAAELGIRFVAGCEVSCAADAGPMHLLCYFVANGPSPLTELLARLRVALRHSTNQEEAAVVQVKNLVIDLATRRVTVGGKEVKLARTEYNLLRLLARHAGKVLTHRQILREVWGPGHEDDTHYLRVYIAHLREKSESNRD